ncbi:MAG: hypothetical protein K2X87_33735 [Gemmataceae bacterium]|nr:hypothetical protein [Gemmataceae bacterium]
MGKGRKPKPRPTAARRWPRRVAAALVTLAAAAGAVVAVRWVGDEATSRIARHDRYAVPFAEVEFDPPPGTGRDTFLAEVRYAGQPPDPVHPLDPADRGRLAAAFAAHPWVEAAEVVAADPPAAVRVRLRFRTPVLAVRQTDGPIRLVDGEGVLLPPSPVPAGVAELTTPVPPPSAAAGRVWDDETVRRAVELVKAYRPAKLEKTPTGWRLILPDGKVLSVG